MPKIRIVHYLNQFFGGIGGEDKADFRPTYVNGPVGPGKLFQKIFGDNAEITATIICGDSYFAENQEQALSEILFLINGFKPDIVIAGPAFNAGRYGLACGAVCEAVQKLNIPAVCGMHPENPGADLYNKTVWIIKTKDSVAGLKEAAEKMARFALKLLNKESIGSPDEENYIKRGLRQNYFAKKTGAERAIEMLLKKISGRPFQTEYPLPVFDRVEPAPAITDISRAKIALVTSGGIVPKGNPDRIESSSASKFGRYLIPVENLTPSTHESCHGGYDNTYANADPHRVLPIDVLRDLEQEGKIGALLDFYYVTVGNGTSVANGKKFGQAIAQKLKEYEVQAVILTST